MQVASISDDEAVHRRPVEFRVNFNGREMSGSVYVLAVVGQSPAVLTELLWWVARRRRQAIAGIEVWTTEGGAAALRALVAGPAWQRLQERIGRLPELAPADTPPSATFGFRLHCHVVQGVVVKDVRTRQEALQVNKELHDRFSSLRRSLPSEIPVLGSLAGGRKTVSAALQNAFCLQALRSDELVHVLLDARLEAFLKESRRLPEYVFPTAEWAQASGVPEEDQVLAYAIPVPRIRLLAPDRLPEVLRSKPWDEVWPLVDAEVVPREAELCQVEGGGWHYVVHARGRHIGFDEELTPMCGAVLAAFSQMPPAATAGDVVRWLDAHPAVGWRPREDPDDKARAPAVQNASWKLRARLAEVPIGLEHFVPAVSQYGVDAAVTVVLLDGTRLDAS